ncbi:HNH endonuclease [Listeria weihenstephanensis]|uniref:HNH endonuclease n=1 Tax=Listeria weihenstephanensis TaxID=1006155 RepID=A0A841Z8N4_9LIST|nr:HNH endonuclease signature motif containing protein [Listeria weihenstephanensis]MBC1501554.1 HNH endonuclease [Listeria weihenstephanensis]
MKTVFDGVHYFYDDRLLTKQASITAIALHTKNKGKRKITYDEAKQLIHGGVAGMIQPDRIHIFYREIDIKRMVRRRDRQLCVYCGGRGDTADHVIPACEGGLTTFTNLVCACATCNFAKDSLTLHLYQKRLLHMNIFQRWQHRRKLVRQQFIPYLPKDTQQYNVFYTHTKKLNKTITDTVVLLQHLDKRLVTLDSRLKKMESQIKQTSKTTQSQFGRLDTSIQKTQVLLADYIETNTKRTLWQKIFH